MQNSLSVLRAFALLWGVIVCPLAILLLLTCVTTQGLLFGIAALLLGMAPALAWFDPERAWARRLSFVCLTVWLVIALWLGSTSPTGRALENARVQNRYTGGESRYHRHALGAMLPEIDQFMMGFRLVPFVDKFFTQNQARQLSSLTQSIYSELEADPDFHALGSVMPAAYDDLWGFNFESGHYFLYVPPHVDRHQPAPALVFLHGSGGNFKAYTWLLSKLADELGMIVIAPSYGMGNWDPKQTAKIIAPILDDAAKIAAIDPKQLHLAGLSNGGLGVTHLAVSGLGERFRSLIFISPVFHDTMLEARTLVPKWKDKSILILSGQNDERVPAPYVNRSAAILKTAGAKVGLKAYELADHFLLFTHREQWMADMSAWLKSQMNPDAADQGR